LILLIALKDISLVAFVAENNCSSVRTCEMRASLETTWLEYISNIHYSSSITQANWEVIGKDTEE